MKMKKQKNTNPTNKMLNAADIVLISLFGLGALIIIALFIYVLTHEAL